MVHFEKLHNIQIQKLGFSQRDDERPQYVFRDKKRSNDANKVFDIS